MTIAIPLPPAALADCGAILGMRGAGKSGTGRGILEHELDAGHRCCVLDPKGDWYGIRLTKDGEPSRFEIPVFGGEHGDIAITDDMGAQLGEIVATSADSSVIDLSGFSRAGMLRFMTGFAEALFMHNRQPLTLLVDKADQLAPQRVPAEVAKLLHHMEALVRQGRQRGILMWMLTQRPAVLNKNLLSQAASLVAMKMTGPQDRAAIRAWMDGHDPERAAAIEKDLAKLKVGQAWAWVPEASFLERVQFPLYESYDSGRTPKHGETVGSVALKPLDVAGLAALLGRKDDEPSEVEQLSRRIRSMQTALDRKDAQIADAQRERSDAIDAANRYLALLVQVQDVIGIRIGSAAIVPLPAGADPARYRLMVDADDVVRPFPLDPDPADRVGAVRARIADAPAAPAIEARPDAAAALASALAGDPEIRDLTPAMRRIVYVLAADRGAPIAREDLASRAAVSPKSSNMGIGLKRLIERGLVASPTPDTFAATPAILPKPLDPRS